MSHTNLLKKGMNLMLSIALFLCLSLTVLLVLFYENTRATASARIQNNHQKILWSIEMDMETLEQTIQNTALSSPVQAVFLNGDLKHPRVSMQAQVRDVFSQAFSYNPYIKGIALYDKDRKFMFSSGTFTIPPDDLPEYWSGNASVAWSGSRRMGNNGYGGLIQIVFPIYEKSTTKLLTHHQVGYLSFLLSPEWIGDILAEKGDDAYVCLKDVNGDIIGDFTTDTRADRENYVMICNTPIENTGWELQSNLIRMRITEDMKPMLLLSVFSVLLMLLLFARMLLYYRNAICAPLGRIQDFMERIPDIHARMDIPDNENNELLDMMTMLNGMLNSLEKKNDELLQSRLRILQEETARQQMELIAYRNQVNPHFLYNTLDCMRGMALMYQAPEIVDMTQALSGMFHYTVKGEITATLAQEIVNVENYAKIMAYRFTKEFRVDLPHEEKYERYLVIRNLLQPLVENAVLHGLNQTTDNGVVCIEISEPEKDMLRILVWDNGQGMEEDRIRELNDQLLETRQKYVQATTGQMHIGLQNISRRLFLHYGERASLRIAHRDQGGTVVEILLPRVEIEEDEL